MELFQIYFLKIINQKKNHYNQHILANVKWAYLFQLHKIPQSYRRWTCRSCFGYHHAWRSISFDESCWDAAISNNLWTWGKFSLIDDAKFYSSVRVTSGNFFHSHIRQILQILYHSFRFLIVILKVEFTISKFFKPTLTHRRFLRLEFCRYFELLQW